MLTFFRQIRKGFLGSGQAKRYLLYAFGEILLVMIGILLALQVNNWNETRKDRQLKKTYTQRLITDLRQDTTNIRILTEEVKYRQKIISDMIRAITMKSDDQALFVKVDSFLANGWRIDGFTPTTSTYNDLSQTGNMRVFAHSGESDRIIQYYTFLNEQKETHQLNVDWITPLDGMLTIDSDALAFDSITKFLFEGRNPEAGRENLKNNLSLLERNAAGHYWLNDSLIRHLATVKTKAFDLLTFLLQE